MIAARHQQHGAIAGRGEDLMRINAGIEFLRLRDRRADRAVGVDAMHRDIARVVIGGQQKSAAGIDADMDRARRQRRRIAVQAATRPVAGSIVSALAKCLSPATPGPPLLDTT